MYTNPEEVRSILGLKIEDVSDVDLDRFISQAQYEFLKSITLEIRNDMLKGKIDGKNTTFSTHYSPIADRNYDLTVNSLDITVYKWKDNTKTRVKVSSIDMFTGTIVLAEAVSKDYDYLTADYLYYPFERVFFKLFSRCTALLAGYYWVLSEYLLIPEQWYHGAYRFRLREPHLYLLEEYHRLLEIVIGRISYREEHDTIPIMREILK